MQFDKYNQRIQYLQELIEKQRTGTPKELAGRLGISERMVYRYIDLLKDQGRPVHFCNKRKSYFFSPLT
ncbi:MAG: helix-turn-helix domain-containing protein [Cyclobacteriaceae bacterium]